MIGGLVDVMGSREIAAGADPAHRNGKAATLTRCLGHDESMLLGVGCHRLVGGGGGVGLGGGPGLDPDLRLFDFVGDGSLPA